MSSSNLDKGKVKKYQEKIKSLEDKNFFAPSMFKIIKSNLPKVKEFLNDKIETIYSPSGNDFIPVIIVKLSTYQIIYEKQNDFFVRKNDMTDLLLVPRILDDISNGKLNNIYEELSFDEFIFHQLLICYVMKEERIQIKLSRFYNILFKIINQIS